MCTERTGAGKGQFVVPSALLSKPSDRVETGQGLENKVVSSSHCIVIVDKSGLMTSVL